MTPSRTRRRALLYPLTGHYYADVRTWAKTGSDKTVRTEKFVDSYYDGYEGTQITVSEGHPWPPRKGASRGDIGGDFYTKKEVAEVKPSNAILDGGIITTHWDAFGMPSAWRHVKGAGDLYAMYPGKYGRSPFPIANASSDGVLDQFGATAVARCKPTNPIADLSVALGEIYREGLPDLPSINTWRSRASVSRDAGDEYLNIVFGWLPLVSEIRKVADAVSRSDAVLRQYEKDSGKMIRRRYEFPADDVTTKQVMETGALPYGAFHSDFTRGPNTGVLVRYRQTYRRRWFSGAFTYHLPYGYDSRVGWQRAALEAKQVYGLTLDPEVLWNLAPWSWAVDWFSNAGDVLSNVSDVLTDGLVMRYGYIMEHTRVSDTYVLEGGGVESTSVRPTPLVFTTEVKKRRRANPFGFGVSWNGLSPRQIAIAAALGLSRWT